MSNSAADAGSRRNPEAVIVIVALSSGFGGPAGTAGGVGATGVGGCAGFSLAHATAAARSTAIASRLGVILFLSPQPPTPASNPQRNRTPYPFRKTLLNT